MDNTFIVEPSSSEEEETDSDGNDGWLKHDKQDVIYDPKTMFLDMKPKQLPSFSQTNDLTKTYRMVIDSNDLIPLDKDGKEIEKDLPDDSDIKTHYSPQFIFGFRLDFNKLSHKSGGFKNVTEIHIQDLYVSPITSGDHVNGQHTHNTQPLDLDLYFDSSNEKYVKLSQSISYPYSKIKGNKTLGSDNIQSSILYPGYLPRVSYIDIVIDELPSINQYQHNSRSVFERRNYKYHENGSYKDNVSVIVNSTNLHEISLNRLTFKFYLSGSNKIYNQITPTPPTYDELPSHGDRTNSFPSLPSGDVLAVFHTDTVEYKQISMAITVKVKEI